jgi:hypothetical protein
MVQRRRFVYEEVEIVLRESEKNKERREVREKRIVD